MNDVEDDSEEDSEEDRIAKFLKSAEGYRKDRTILAYNTEKEKFMSFIMEKYPEEIELRDVKERDVIFYVDKRSHWQPELGDLR